jgi:hypothetical protein
MTVLRSHNFDAAVNTIPYPAQHRRPFTLRELAQPAVTRYGDFPLFLRKSLRFTKLHDVAFNVFFGRPILFGEHHDVFRQPDSLVQMAMMVNSVAPGVEWCNLTKVVHNSVLRRRAPDGACHIRAYSGTVEVTNDFASRTRFVVEWKSSSVSGTTPQVLQDGAPCAGLEVDDGAVRLSVDLSSGATTRLTLDHTAHGNTHAALGLRWTAEAVLRRRLTEFRDNYLSKHRRFLTAARTLQRSLQR